MALGRLESVSTAGEDEPYHAYQLMIILRRNSLVPKAALNSPAQKDPNHEGSVSNGVHFPCCPSSDT